MLLFLIEGAAGFPSIDFLSDPRLWLVFGNVIDAEPASNNEEEEQDENDNERNDPSRDPSTLLFGHLCDLPFIHTFNNLTSDGVYVLFVVIFFIIPILILIAVIINVALVIFVFLIVIVTVLTLSLISRFVGSTTIFIVVFVIVFIIIVHNRVR